MMMMITALINTQSEKTGTCGWNTEHVWFLTFLHQLFIQVNVTLAATLLNTEMKTPRSFFFSLNGLLKDTDRTSHFQHVHEIY